MQLASFLKIFSITATECIYEAWPHGDTVIKVSECTLGEHHRKAASVSFRDGKKIYRTGAQTLCLGKQRQGSVVL
jgi:hypothetical protein